MKKFFPLEYFLSFSELLGQTTFCHVKYVIGPCVHFMKFEGGTQIPSGSAASCSPQASSHHQQVADVNLPGLVIWDALARRGYFSLSYGRNFLELALNSLILGRGWAGRTSRHKFL